MANTYDVLGKVVSEAKCKPGWKFSLRQGEDDSMVLVIRLDTTDNYDQAFRFIINHFHPVPVTTYNEATWRRWLFDQCVRSMSHEIGEALTFNGVRPFAPCHGPGEDPYTVHEFRPEIDFLTAQSGKVREGPI